MSNKKLPLPKVSGIYKITCTVNNKFYIGSANNINRRWVTHRGQLRHNTHSNPYLQRAYNKYGEESFNIICLEQCTVEDLLRREQHYLDVYKPFNENGFNISKSASNPMQGRKHTPATRLKQREAGIDRTLHRCIVVSTKEVIYLTQYQIHHDWNIKDFAAFIRKPGHWTKRGLVSFIKKEFNNKLYNDNEAEQFLLDVKTFNSRKLSIRYKQYRCIVLATNKIIYLNTGQIKRGWNVSNPRWFVTHSGLVRNGLMSFTDTLYTDQQIEEYISYAFTQRAL